MSENPFNGQAWKAIALVLGKSHVVLVGVVTALAGLALTNTEIKVALGLAEQEREARMVRAQALATMDVLEPPDVEVIEGHAATIDTDAMFLDGYNVRLYGLDALGYEQLCDWPEEGRVACGQMAFRFAAKIITAKIITCRPVGKDYIHNIYVARCRDLRDRDIGRMILEAGWAIVDDTRLPDYVAAEKKARDAKRGLWRGELAEPVNWRSR